MSLLSPKIYLQRFKNTFWHLPKAIFHNFRFGFPGRRLTLIGVTGTDGKTTTCHLIYQCLINSGVKTGLISTTGIKINDQEYPSGLHTTSPNSYQVQKLLSEMASKGATHAVIEVTAHGIDQYRFWGCRFDIAILTNTSHEHLDDFANMDTYVGTKAKLFDSAKFAILNHDDPSFPLILPRLKTPFVTYGTNPKANYQFQKAVLTAKNLIFTVNQRQYVTDSPYHYQIYNILATLAAITRLGLDQDLLESVIAHFPIIRGRREEIKNKLKIRTIIDFAHTPKALQDTLSSLKKTAKKRLIVIFGATGGRDRSKRPEMGKMVSQIADIAIVTSDDTRKENIRDINQQIVSGFDHSRLQKKLFTYFDIPNRQDAFNQAIKISQPGDTVVACGKGHETTILIGATEYPWSEAEAFRTAFRLKTNGRI